MFDQRKSQSQTLQILTKLYASLEHKTCTNRFCVQSVSKNDIDVLAIGYML